jgi:hypothetical protein
VGLFDAAAKAVPPAHPEARKDLSPEQRAALPPGFAAAGEALASGMGSVDTCTAVGRELALDGMTLPDVLDAFEATSRLVRGHDPSYEEVRAVCVAWGEATLGYLQRLTCADPVTGLASLAHLQARFTELYRGELRHRAREDWALLVVDAPGGVESPGDRIVEDLLVLRFGEVARTVFSAGETFGRLARRRIAVVCRRDDLLERRVRLVRTMLDHLGYAAPRAQVLVEELPPTLEQASALLAELARV